MPSVSHIIDWYSFKQSIIDSGVKHHFILLLAFDFPAIAQRKQPITHALCIESYTELTRKSEPKYLHRKRLPPLER